MDTYDFITQNLAAAQTNFRERPYQHAQEDAMIELPTPEEEVSLVSIAHVLAGLSRQQLSSSRAHPV